MASRCAFMAPTIMGSSCVPDAGAETAGVEGTDQAEPDLSVRAAGEQPVRGGDLVRIDFGSTRLDVNGNEFADILGGEPRLDLALVDLVAAPGELFLAVPGLRRNSHETILHQGLESSSPWCPPEKEAPAGKETAGAMQEERERLLWRVQRPQVANVNVSCTGTAARPAGLAYCLTMPVWVSVTVAVKSTSVVAAK